MQETALLLSHVPPLYESNNSTCQRSYYSYGILLYKIEQSQDDGAATLRSMYLLPHVGMSHQVNSAILEHIYKLQTNLIKNWVYI